MIDCIYAFFGVFLNRKGSQTVFIVHSLKKADVLGTYYSFREKYNLSFNRYCYSNLI